VRAAASDADISALLAAVIQRDLCHHLLQSFIALPDLSASAALGPSAGETPNGGRWWIRECGVRAENGVAAIQLSGPGWIWVDETTLDHHLKQHVIFNAKVGIGGLLHLGYDRESRIASVWFSPSIPAIAMGASTGAVTLETGLIGSVLDVLPSTDAVGDARAMIGTRVSSAFSSAMSAGFTITYDVRRQQSDAILQALAPGSTPTRPFMDGRRWIVNERDALHPGKLGLHVLGPFPRAIVDVDLRIEGGYGVRYEPVCQDALLKNFAPLVNGAPPVDFIDTNRRIDLVATGQETHRISMPACPWYLVLTPNADYATVAIRVRDVVTTTVVD
jgi:hypothetical protein